MGMHMNEHEQRWEEQRERLSAYLDGRLMSAERAELEQHLAECARCTAELAELRQVVALLGAMPAPRLPRSFTLPEIMPHEAPSPVLGRASGPARRGAPAWTQVARWAGGLAAAAGFVLLVGSALVGFGGHLAGGAGASTASSAQPIPAASHTAPTPGQPDQHSQYGASPAAAPSPTGRGLDHNAPTTPTQTSGAVTAPPPRTAPHTLQSGQAGTGISLDPLDLPIAGTALLVAGAATFTAGSVARRRAAR
jgi:Putative zinc-finger